MTEFLEALDERQLRIRFRMTEIAAVREQPNTIMETTGICTTVVLKSGMEIRLRTGLEALTRRLNGEGETG